LLRANLFFSLRVVYYESIKRELKIKPIYECRCDERLQTKRFTRLSYTGLVVELEHLKIKTRLTNEKFTNREAESVYYKQEARGTAGCSSVDGHNFEIFKEEVGDSNR
jgi:hypothetical protein